MPADMKAISGHMKCWGEWRVRVDMKSHQSTYQRNARRNRRGGERVRLYGRRVGMRWQLVADGGGRSPPNDAETSTTIS